MTRVREARLADETERMEAGTRQYQDPSRGMCVCREELVQLRAVLAQISRLVLNRSGAAQFDLVH